MAWFHTPDVQQSFIFVVVVYVSVVTLEDWHLSYPSLQVTCALKHIHEVTLRAVCWRSSMFRSLWCCGDPSSWPHPLPPVVLCHAVGVPDLLLLLCNVLVDWHLTITEPCWWSERWRVRWFGDLWVFRSPEHTGPFPLLLMVTNDGPTNAAHTQTFIVQSQFSVNLKSNCLCLTLSPPLTYYLVI